MGTAVERENVTLSLPADLLREARHMAVDRGLSLSRFLSQLLEERVTSARAYERARVRWQRRVREAGPLGTHGNATWRRDELHER